jgi:hypothetical protein
MAIQTKRCLKEAVGESQCTFLELRMCPSKNIQNAAANLEKLQFCVQPVSTARVASALGQSD